MTVTVRARSIFWFVGGSLTTLLVVWVVMSAWRVDAAAQDDEATFVPISPCRVVDQRESSPMVAAGIVTQQITGTNGNCTVPSSAVAVSMNVTIARPTARSFLTVFPADLVSPPVASNLNWTAASSPTPNKVDVKLSPGGAVKFYNDAGQVFVIADVVGYYTSTTLQDLSAQVASLEGDLAALQAQVDASEPAAVEARLAGVEALTASMSTVTVDGQPTVRFSGVNVQLVDGTGDTDGAPNGRGNLIVGYNEDTGTAATRSGSHFVVVGVNHDYSSFGGLVAGQGHVVSGDYASVTGGAGNTASGNWSSVSGGIDNTASGAHSVVSGGDRNVASGSQAMVAGGGGNRASGGESAVAGGNGNEASGSNSTVSGGATNSAEGSFTSVSGGVENTATAGSSSISGGRFNATTGNYASVSGGSTNTASGAYASVAGGQLNIAGAGLYASVAGGSENWAAGDRDAVAGGDGVVCQQSGARVCGDGANGVL